MWVEGGIHVQDGGVTDSFGGAWVSTEKLLACCGNRAKGMGTRRVGSRNDEGAEMKAQRDASVMRGSVILQVTWLPRQRGVSACDMLWPFSLRPEALHDTRRPFRIHERRPWLLLVCGGSFTSSPS